MIFVKKLRVALLGQGRSGYSIHGQHLLKDTERFEVVAVVDALPERREKAEKVFGCTAYETYQELFGRTDIDLVVNSLISPYHCPVTVEFLEHGFNVLCEKPIGEKPEDIDRMVEAAKKSGKMFAMFQQSRLAPYFKKIKEVLASGVLGRVVQISIAFDGFARRWDWQTLQENVAGSLYNTGPHPVDQALNLLAYDGMPQVFCKMDRVNTFGDAEDYVKIILTAPDRPLIDLSISSCNAYPSGTYNIQCEHGGLWSNQSEVKWRWFDPKEAPEQRLIRTPLTDANGNPAYCGEKLPWQEARWSANEGETAFISAVHEYYSNIYEHLTEGKPLVIRPEEVRQQIAVICECHRQNPLSRLEDE